MYAGPAVSHQGPFDPSAAAAHQQQQQQQPSPPQQPLFNAFQSRPQSHHRSISLSSASFSTIRRPGPISQGSSQNPDADAALAGLRIAAQERMSSHDHDHERRRSIAINPSDESIGSASGLANRWSHSTTSSVASLQTRRNRSSSGAVLTSLAEGYHSPRQRVDVSPRASPQRHLVGSTYSPSWTSPERTHRGSRADNITALPSLHPVPALTVPNDVDSPATVQAEPTPQTYTSHEYFDNSPAPYGVVKSKRVVMVRNPSVPSTVPPPSRAPPEAPEAVLPTGAPLRPEMEQNGHDAQPTRGSGSHSKGPRPRERTEKDKKSMLSRALQKANTAVLLDNAQNYEGALEAYGDACDLLCQVMERTSGEDDKAKLDAIRVTYSNRMQELRLLVQEQPLATDEKNLPARPMSNGSLEPTSPVGGAAREYVATPSDGDAPQLSYPDNSRDSFFARTMEAVETSFTSDVDDVSASAPKTVQEERGKAGRKPSVHLPPPEHSEYMPRPLSPKRPSPASPSANDSWHRSSSGTTQAEQTPPGQAHTKDPTSWLDPIDESGSSCSDSVHSRDSLDQTRRKHLRHSSNQTDPDFDAAFDAAVEAAYDDGFEPDLEARRKRMTAYKQRPQTESIIVPASDIDEIMPGSYQHANATVSGAEQIDEEEERILDEMVNDFGPSFNFDLKSKSALPRQSDSSGYSRSTWQSSQMSDRATAATSLSTVAEDGLSNRFSKPVTARDSSALPPLSAPPQASLPIPPSGTNKRESNVRTRRLSGMNAKQLKIETEVRQRASTFHHARSPFQEDEETLSQHLQPTPSEVRHENILASPPSLELHAASEEMTDSFDQSFKSTTDEPYDLSTTTGHRPSYEETSSDLPPGTRPTLFRKNKSSISLRDHTEHMVLLASPAPDSGPSFATPMSSTFMTFAAKRNQNPLASQRAQLPSLGQATYDQHIGGGIHLFDTSLSTAQDGLSSPKSPTSPLPASLEPCPSPFLLRPFWMMRALSSTISHPRGGFLTSRLFVPREVWQTRGVKLKLIEDKISNCDLLTAALGRLAGVDTFDADAVMDELQSFEEVMERVQTALAKKLGGDVGVHGAAGMFRDASTAAAATTAGSASNNSSDASAGAEKAAKSNSGKSYLSSWRKLRSKNSGAPLTPGINQATNVKSASGSGEKNQHTMSSVPMTSFVPVERRGHKKEARNLAFEGPNREYMGSLARLFDGVQILDQIARQVEDPGLKHSSPTHVGLELSIRHAAEFFGFYICRFVLADLGTLMDKFLKRGGEWVLA